MAVINFLGGLTGAYTNIKAGYQEAQARDRAEEDRKFQLEQRDLESKKIKATKDEMERQEKLRTANAGVSLEETVEVPDDTAPSTPVAPVRNGVAEVDGDANPVTVDPATGISPPATKKVTRQRRMEDVYRDFAKNSQSVGDTTGYLTMSAQAVQAAANRASSQFTRIAAASTGKTTEQLAEELRQLYDTDILPGKVGKVTRGADGSVDIQFIDNETQQTFTQNFKDAGQLMTVAQSYFDPVNYAKQVDARRTHLMKLEEERNKVHTIGPRGALATRQDGIFAVNPQYSRDYDNEGAGGSGGSGGAGGGSGGGKGKIKTPAEQAAEIALDALGKADGSPGGAQLRTTVHRIIGNVYAANPVASPGTAASIAITAATKPESVTFGLDKNGLVNKLFSDPDIDNGKKYSLSRAGTVEQMEKVVGLNGMKTAVGDMMGMMTEDIPEDKRPALQAEILLAAKDPAARSRYINAAKAAGKDAGAITRQLDLIGKYIPGSTNPPNNTNTRVQPVVGMGIPENIRQELAAETSRKEARAQALSKADSDKANRIKAIKESIAGLNDGIILSMTPEQAEEFEKKNREGLTIDQRKKLINRSLGGNLGPDLRDLGL